MATKRLNKNEYEVIVTAATDNSYEVGYAKVNGKIIPFNRKVIIDRNDLSALKGLKEPRKKSGSGLDPRELMEQLKIPQEKANQLARQQDKEMNGKVNMRMVPRYNITILSEGK